MPSKLDQELKKLKVGLSQKFIIQMFLQNALYLKKILFFNFYKANKTNNAQK